MQITHITRFGVVHEECLCYLELRIVNPCLNHLYGVEGVLRFCGITTLPKHNIKTLTHGNEDICCPGHSITSLDLTTLMYHDVITLEWVSPKVPLLQSKIKKTISKWPKQEYTMYTLNEGFWLWVSQRNWCGILDDPIVSPMVISTTIIIITPTLYEALSDVRGMILPWEDMTNGRITLLLSQ